MMEIHTVFVRDAGPWHVPVWHVPVWCVLRCAAVGLMFVVQPCAWDASAIAGNRLCKRWTDMTIQRH